MQPMTDKLCSRCGSSVFVQDGDKLRTHDCQGEQAQAPKREPWISFAPIGHIAQARIPGAVWNYYEPEEQVAPSEQVGVILDRLGDMVTWVVMTPFVPPALVRILCEAVQREAERQERVQGTADDEGAAK